MKKSTICHLISSTGLYGAETVVLNLMEAMKDDMRFRCVLGCVEDKDNKECALYQEAQKLGYHAFQVNVNNISILKDIFVLRRTFSKEGVSLVHSHGYKASVMGYLLSVISDIKILITCHSYGFLWTSGDLKLRLYEKLESIVMKRAGKVVGVSEKIVSQLRGLNIPDDRLIVIPNGISFRQFRLRHDVVSSRDEFNIPPDHLIIGSLGRLIEVKGYVYLIESARQIVSKFPDVSFIIAGEGPLRDALCRLVDEYQLGSNFKLIGYTKNKIRLLQLFDIFVLPSLSEGTPMALLEAMATGLPCLVTDVGGNRNVIENGVDGILIPPGETNLLTNMLLKLLNNKSLRDRLSAGARKKIEMGYSAETMRDRYFNIYNELMLRGNC